MAQYDVVDHFMVVVQPYAGVVPVHFRYFRSRSSRGGTWTAVPKRSCVSRARARETIAMMADSDGLKLGPATTVSAIGTENGLRVYDGRNARNGRLRNDRDGRACVPPDGTGFRTTFAVIHDGGARTDCALRTATGRARPRRTADRRRDASRSREARDVHRDADGSQSPVIVYF